MDSNTEIPNESSSTITPPTVQNNNIVEQSELRQSYQAKRILNDDTWVYGEEARAARLKEAR